MRAACRAVGGALGRPPPAGTRVLQQGERLGVARVALQHRADLPDGLVPLAGPQQQGRKVHAERHIVRHGLDGLAQTGEHGGVGFHAAVRIVGFVSRQLACSLTG